MPAWRIDSAAPASNSDRSTCLSAILVNHALPRGAGAAPERRAQRSPPPRLPRRRWRRSRPRPRRTTRCGPSWTRNGTTPSARRALGWARRRRRRGRGEVRGRARRGPARGGGLARDDRGRRGGSLRVACRRGAGGVATGRVAGKGKAALRKLSAETGTAVSIKGGANGSGARLSALAPDSRPARRLIYRQCPARNTENKSWQKRYA